MMQIMSGGVYMATSMRLRARLKSGMAAALPALLRDTPYRLIERKRLQVITLHYGLPFGLICRAW